MVISGSLGFGRVLAEAVAADGTNLNLEESLS
jgi:hypothetical protein